MKKTNTITHAKKSQRLAIAIAISMIMVVAAWAIWFYPAAQNRIASQDRGFKSFASDVLRSLSVFAKDESKNTQDVNVDDLRERVFGDTIQR